MPESLNEILENDSAVSVAQRMLGCLIMRDMDGQKLVGKIVETEAYDQTDAASHSYNGKTLRTSIMFGPSGFAYVYFTYGLHYCMNVVTGPTGVGAAVLIRALEPLEGRESMRAARPRSSDDRNLTNGPAKLCQALHITKQYNGHNLGQPPLQLITKPPVPSSQIVQTTRIGISKAQDTPWRFYLKNNVYVSRK